MTDILGIILARGGSLGLKNKHMLPLLGRSVIEYTLHDVRKSRRITRAVVSTDCPQIRALARGLSFETIDRPPSLATADASVQDACLHALNWVEAASEFRPGGIVVVYGNVPVRPAAVFDRAIELLEQSGCDSVRSLSPVGKWHPAWMHRLLGDVMQPLQPGSIHRRQDLEPIYLHDGAAVAVSRKALLSAERNPADPHAFFGTDRRGIVSEMDQTVEIDHVRDLYWAEAVLRARGEADSRRRMAV